MGVVVVRCRIAEAGVDAERDDAEQGQDDRRICKIENDEKPEPLPGFCIGFVIDLATHILITLTGGA